MLVYACGSLLATGGDNIFMTSLVTPVTVHTCCYLCSFGRNIWSCCAEQLASTPSTSCGLTALSLPSWTETFVRTIPVTESSQTLPSEPASVQIPEYVLIDRCEYLAIYRDIFQWKLSMSVILVYPPRWSG